MFSQIKKASPPLSFHSRTEPKVKGNLDELTARFNHPDWANELMKSLPEHMSDDAARKCQELVDLHPTRVSVLLAAQPEVAWAVMHQLRDMPSPTQAKLVEALLNAGHLLTPFTRDLSSESLDLIDARRAESEEAFATAKREYDNQTNHPDARVGKSYLPVRDKPYLSTDRRYSAENHNGKVNHEILKQRIICHDYATEMHLIDQEKRYDKLQGFARGSVGGISPEKLKKKYTDEDPFLQGAKQVSFSQEFFGKLLVPLSLRINPGEERSFALIFPFDAETDDGHAMCVFIKKEKDSALFTISFYDPNVTGNLMRIKVLPEEMNQLEFDWFDKATRCSAWGVKVLTLNVEDIDFAKALTGEFIADDATTQQFAFANALACGQVAGLEMAASTLQKDKLPLDIKLASRGMYYACQNGKFDIIKPLSDFLFNLKPPISSGDLKTLFLGQRLVGCSGIQMALKKGKTSTVKAIGEMLNRLQSRLDPDDLNELLMEAGPGFVTAAERGDVDTVKVFGNALFQLRSRLFPRNLINILASAMFAALKNGNTAMAKTIGDILLPFKSELGSENLKKIFQITSATGIPCWQEIIESNRMDAIHTLSDITNSLTPELQSKDLKDMLQKMDGHGRPFLNKLVSNGSPEHIRSYGQFLLGLKSALHSKDLAEIITSEDGQKMSSGYKAVQVNQIDHLMALGDVVIDLMGATRPTEDTDSESSLSNAVPEEGGDADASDRDMEMSLSIPPDSHHTARLPHMKTIFNRAEVDTDDANEMRRIEAVKAPRGDMGMPIPPAMNIHHPAYKGNMVEYVHDAVLQYTDALGVLNFLGPKHASAMHSAMRTNNAKAVETSGNILLHPKLKLRGQAFKIQALVKDESGATAWHAGMRANAGQAINAYCDLLIESDLLFDNLMEVLQAKDAAGRTGWQSAWAMENGDAIKAGFDTLVRLKPRLRPEDWKSLIQDTDSKGNALILQGLKHKNPKMVEAARYIQQKLGDDWQSMFPGH